MARRRFTIDDGNSGGNGGVEGIAGTPASGPGSGEPAGNVIDGTAQRIDDKPDGTGGSQGTVGEIGTAADPASATGTAKPKTRRPYTRRQNQQAPSGPEPLALADVKRKVQGYSHLFAMFVRQPIAAYTDDEAEAIAKEVVEVSRFYNLNVLSGKNAALFGLFSTFGFITFNKVQLIKAMLAAEHPQPATQPATPTDVGANAGLSPNVIDLTGEHLKGVKVP